MRLIFSYSLEKDIQNFKIASKSINNKTPTKMQTAYIERFGPVFEDYALAQFITEYLEATHLDLAREVERIERQWRSIEDALQKRGRRHVLSGKYSRQRWRSFNKESFFLQ